MLRTIRFYIACFQEAADGTLDRANAWFWPIGIPIVALGGWYWEMGQLTIPDTAQGFIAFMAVTVAVSWFVFFVIRFFGAPARLYARLADEKAEIEARLRAREQKRAILSVGGPYLVRDASSDGGIWKIKIHNDGAAAANVHLSLCNIDPPPNSQHWPADYPFRLIQSGLTLDSNECQINQGGDAIFEVTRIWTAAHNAGFLTTLNTRAPGNQVKIEHDEQWKMKYEITAENAEVVKFTLRMKANAERITFEKVV